MKISQQFHSKLTLHFAHVTMKRKKLLAEFKIIRPFYARMNSI